MGTGIVSWLLVTSKCTGLQQAEHKDIYLVSIYLDCMYTNGLVLLRQPCLRFDAPGIKFNGWGLTLPSVLWKLIKPNLTASFNYKNEI